MMDKLFGIDISYYIIGVVICLLILILACIIMSVKIRALNRKYEEFMGGKDAESLEDIILERFKEIDHINEDNKKINISLNKINENLLCTYQKIGIVKYDAFKEMGGKLSFSLVLLNNKNDGFVMNSVHSRDGCYTYIKSIEKGESSILLSEEEKEALSIAIKG